MLSKNWINFHGFFSLGQLVLSYESSKVFFPSLLTNPKSSELLSMQSEFFPISNGDQSKLIAFDVVLVCVRIAIRSNG